MQTNFCFRNRREDDFTGERQQSGRTDDAAPQKWAVMSLIAFLLSNFFPFPSRLELLRRHENQNSKKATKNFRQQQVRPLKFHFRDSSCVFACVLKSHLHSAKARRRKSVSDWPIFCVLLFFLYIWYGNGLVREVKNRRVWRRRRQRRGK